MDKKSTPGVHIILSFFFKNQSEMKTIGFLTPNIDGDVKLKISVAPETAWVLVLYQDYVN